MKGLGRWFLINFDGKEVKATRLVVTYQTFTNKRGLVSLYHHHIRYLL